MRRSLVALVVAGFVALGTAACGDDDGASVRESGSSTGSGSGSASGSGTASGSGVAGACEPVGDLADASTRVEGTLSEYEIELETGSAPSGAIGFVLRNVGSEPHELVVIQGVAPAELPLADGALDEDALPDGALIGEIEAFPAGTSCNGVFVLQPGEYTLVCNVVEEGDDGHAHLAEGMVTTFTVS